jgi:hypothetical protein
MLKSKYTVGANVGRLRLIGCENDLWRCKCSCGNEPVFQAADLAKVKSCGCIVILGLDIATTSGWAVRYSWKDPSAILCGTFYVGKNDSGDETKWEEKYALAANHVYKLLKEHKPDFVAIEEPEHRIRRFGKKQDPKKPIDFAAIKAFIARLSALMFKHGMESKEAVGFMSKLGGATSNSNQMQLSGLIGAVVGVCMNMGTPYGTVTARSWHAIYGKGVKPAEGQDWKDIAIARCEQAGITMPSTIKERRDACEAVWISGYWHKCDLPNFKWIQERHKALRSDAAKIAAARTTISVKEYRDLFSGAAA